jgi:hypothetical protein
VPAMPFSGGVHLRVGWHRGHLQRAAGPRSAGTALAGGIRTAAAGLLVGAVLLLVWSWAPAAAAAGGAARPLAVPGGEPARSDSDGPGAVPPLPAGTDTDGRETLDELTALAAALVAQLQQAEPAEPRPVGGDAPGQTPRGHGPHGAQPNTPHLEHLWRREPEQVTGDVAAQRPGGLGTPELLALLVLVAELERRERREPGTADRPGRARGQLAQYPPPDVLAPVEDGTHRVEIPQPFAALPPFPRRTFGNDADPEERLWERYLHEFSERVVRSLWGTLGGSIDPGARTAPIFPLQSLYFSALSSGSAFVNHWIRVDRGYAIGNTPTAALRAVVEQALLGRPILENARASMALGIALNSLNVYIAERIGRAGTKYFAPANIDPKLLALREWFNAVDAPQVPPEGLKTGELLRRLFTRAGVEPGAAPSEGAARELLRRALDRLGSRLPSEGRTREYLQRLQRRLEPIPPPAPPPEERGVRQLLRRWLGRQAEPDPPAAPPQERGVRQLLRRALDDLDRRLPSEGRTRGYLQRLQRRLEPIPPLAPPPEGNVSSRILRRMFRNPEHPARRIIDVGELMRGRQLHTGIWKYIVGMGIGVQLMLNEVKPLLGLPPPIAVDDNGQARYATNGDYLKHKLYDAVAVGGPAGIGTGAAAKLVLPEGITVTRAASWAFKLRVMLATLGVTATQKLISDLLSDSHALDEFDRVRLTPEPVPSELLLAHLINYGEAAVVGAWYGFWRNDPKWSYFSPLRLLSMLRALFGGPEVAEREYAREIHQFFSDETWEVLRAAAGRGDAFWLELAELPTPQSTAGILVHLLANIEHLLLEGAETAGQQFALKVVDLNKHDSPPREQLPIHRARRNAAAKRIVDDLAALTAIHKAAWREAVEKPTPQTVVEIAWHALLNALDAEGRLIRAGAGNFVDVDPGDGLPREQSRQVVLDALQGDLDRIRQDAAAVGQIGADLLAAVKAYPDKRKRAWLEQVEAPTPSTTLGILHHAAINAVEGFGNLARAGAGNFVDIDPGDGLPREQSRQAVLDALRGNINRILQDFDALLPLPKPESRPGPGSATPSQSPSASARPATRPAPTPLAGAAPDAATGGPTAVPPGPPHALPPSPQAAAPTPPAEPPTAAPGPGPEDPRTVTIGLRTDELELTPDGRVTALVDGARLEGVPLPLHTSVNTDDGRMFAPDGSELDTNFHALLADRSGQPRPGPDPAAGPPPDHTPSTDDAVTLAGPDNLGAVDTRPPDGGFGG